MSEAFIVRRERNLVRIRAVKNPYAGAWFDVRSIKEAKELYLKLGEVLGLRVSAPPLTQARPGINGADAFK